MALFNRTMRPKPRTLYGIEVKKQPTLYYIEAMERSGRLVYDLLDDAFPGKNPKEILKYLTKLDTESFKELAARLMWAVPKQAVKLLREVIGADEAAWNQLTPYEMSEVLKAFWALNDLNGFFTNARTLLQRAAAGTPSGSNA